MWFLVLGYLQSVQSSKPHAPSTTATTSSVTVSDKALSFVFEIARIMAKDPVVFQAVKESNQKISKEESAMTNENWKTLSVMDAFVQSLIQNKVTQKLIDLKKPFVSEVFISNARGTKIAFLEKTSSWSHAGKPKHDQPMQGKEWRGEVELDDSSGIHQIQVSVPILDKQKPIGSVVVGASIARLPQ